MTDLYRTFNLRNRSITSDKKCYAGQAYDSNSTTIHFTLMDGDEPWDPYAEGFKPFIVFDVYDDCGNPYVYGTTSQPIFDGTSFTIPYDITSKVRSARADYHLWFVRAAVADRFDGTPQGLVVADYLLSARDGVAFKPTNLHPPKCGMPNQAYAPTTAPTTIGALEFMRENAVIMPIEKLGLLDDGGPAGIDMVFHTLGGQRQRVHLPVATLDTDNKVELNSLPVGTEADQIPLLKGTIPEGYTIVSEGPQDQFNDRSGFKAAQLPKALRYVEKDYDTGRMHLIQLIDHQDRVMSEVDLTMEELVKKVAYDHATKSLKIEFGTGVVATVPMGDLVDTYKGRDGEIYVSEPDTASGSPVRVISIASEFKADIDDRFASVNSTTDLHIASRDNPHNVTKAQVGLSDVDNTADVNKPVSGPQQAAINSAKQQVDDRVDQTNRALAATDAKVVGLEEHISGTNGIVETHTKDIQRLDNRDAQLEDSIQKRYTGVKVDELLTRKQDVLRTDSESLISIDSNGYIKYTGDAVHVRDDIVSDSSQPVTSQALYREFATKQDVLVPKDGGHVVIEDGNRIWVDLPKVEVDGYLSPVSENPVKNSVIYRELNNKANIGEGVSQWKGSANGGQYLYNSGDVVVYDYNLYVSRVDNNDHHPTDETCWNVVRSGTLSSVVGLTAPTYIGVFGNDAATDYTITHNLGSRNVIFSIMTNDADHEFRTARVSAPTLNTLRVRLTSPPGRNGLIINVIKARTAQAVQITDYPAALAFNMEEAEWSFFQDTGKPLFAMAYDTEGNDIPGDVIQNSDTGFSSITVGFSAPVAGTLVLGEASKVVDMDAKTELTIPKEPGKGYLVQCYRDGLGQSVLDVIQTDSEIKVGCNVPWTGFVCLYEASQTKSFGPSDLTDMGDGTYRLSIQHNKGRLVGVQVFIDDDADGDGQPDGLAALDVHSTTTMAYAYLNQKVSGKVHIL